VRIYIRRLARAFIKLAKRGYYFLLNVVEFDVEPSLT